MTYELLNRIRMEAQEEISKLKDDNNYIKLKNDLILKDGMKKELGLPYTCLEMALKNENEIIMRIYRKYIDEIEEQDTNGIYYYSGSYQYISARWLESLGLKPTEGLVPRNSTNIDFKKYNNIEGVYSYKFDINSSIEFEKNHIILYDENREGVIPFWITEDFVTKAVRENQEKAVSYILKKYKAIKR